VSVSLKKVGSLIKEEWACYFNAISAWADFGFLTVTEVLMSPDLKVAKVYVSIFGDKEQKKRASPD